MKYFLTASIFVCIGLQLQAQTKFPDKYLPKQQQWNKEWKTLSPNLQNAVITPVQQKTPVLQLKNEEVKTGSNNLGDVYTMTADNMPCLKPFATKDEMPNAIKPKQALPVMPAIKP